MKAFIVRSNMKFESHLYPFLFQCRSCFGMYHCYPQQSMLVQVTKLFISKYV